jgi:hypothetical protein
MGRYLRKCTPQREWGLPAGKSNYSQRDTIAVPERPSTVAVGAMPPFLQGPVRLKYSLRHNAEATTDCNSRRDVVATCSRAAPGAKIVRASSHIARSDVYTLQPSPHWRRGIICSRRTLFCLARSNVAS